MSDSNLAERTAGLKELVLKTLLLSDSLRFFGFVL